VLEPGQGNEAENAADQEDGEGPSPHAPTTTRLGRR
jgi:hypothetical protein